MAVEGRNEGSSVTGVNGDQTNNTAAASGTGLRLYSKWHHLGSTGLCEGLEERRERCVWCERDALG